MSPNDLDVEGSGVSVYCVSRQVRSVPSDDARVAEPISAVNGRERGEQVCPGSRVSKRRLDAGIVCWSLDVEFHLREGGGSTDQDIVVIGHKDRCVGSRRPVDHVRDICCYGIVGARRGIGKRPRFLQDRPHNGSNLHAVNAIRSAVGSENFQTEHVTASGVEFVDIYQDDGFVFASRNGSRVVNDINCLDVAKACGVNGDLHGVIVVVGRRVKYVKDTAWCCYANSYFPSRINPYSFATRTCRKCYLPGCIVSSKFQYIIT